MTQKYKNTKNLGTAKSGTTHFINQRVSAVANIFLGVAIIAIIINTIGKDYQQIVDIIAHPIVSIIIIAFAVSSTIHMKLGMQVIIEDYLNGKWNKTIALLANVFFSYTIMLATIYFTLKIALKN